MIEAGHPRGYDAPLEVTGEAQAKNAREKPHSGRSINHAPSSAQQKSGGKRKRVARLEVEAKPSSSRKTQCSAMEADPKDEASHAQGEEQSLAIQVPDMLEIPENPKSEWFDTLEDVVPSNAWTYYRPKSRIYGVDALIVELTPESETYAGKCYGLKMTMCEGQF
ncbi:hypothetical protein PHYSODRAFT_304370 [Phytophthora sojae]|uniref:Uncharacterized protein n=1 Tax=Phytophthora sojae (strain P6497) TaxID=1094619 RepID=G5A0C4_PHYSP|nr:hypothetical protein PHYSODRAFT_304370 [Phytophthora sojae]EGZ10513.1 hypothetical protein PHYSODRAFT_304370 [Phytophthora sojae]|eukprot:XP_009533258.1 hypothetical protein PHYSODRAFT_304370 [Phytophthora sojae]